MSKKEPKKELVGPWRGLHAAIWLVGLYILLSTDKIFPGILVLVAISVLYEALLARFAPHAFEEEIPNVPETPARVETAPVQPITSAASENPSTSNQEHRLELLPHICPNCNAPIRGNSVKWTGPQSADCPYCGTNLPMSKV